MATYTNTTNPFIKTMSSAEHCCKKDAPGMAKKSIQQFSSQNAEVSLLLDSAADLHNTSYVEQNNNIQKLKLHDVGKEVLSSLKKTTTFEENSIDISSTKLEKAASVLELGADLVDNANQLGLEESRLEEKPQLEQHFSQEQTVISDANNDNENDELDACTEIRLPENQNSRHFQHIELIKKLRLQLFDLEKYAYERGELDQVPLSVLAERQAVILDTLKQRLSLKICTDELEKVKLDELKKQIDEEVHNLLDPLLTKEHLLSQLKTQLTDLERYIAHLHSALGKASGEKNCLCPLHGCSSSFSSNEGSAQNNSSNLIRSNPLPRTSSLIRSLMTQLICTDLKVQESAKKEFDLDFNKKQVNQAGSSSITTQDDPAWSLQIDGVILATDSLVNLLTLEPNPQKTINNHTDRALVESVVRRQLVPAIRDLLSYGLFDPNSLNRHSSYASLLFDPYYLLTSLTCFPSANRGTYSPERGSIENKIHIWNVIEDYYRSRSEPGFKTSSVKTLSQSFNLPPSITGPLKLTSKQALLIAIDDTIESMSKCKPNGPESHFRAFIYTALNRAKLTTWLRIIFRNKSIGKKYYHTFSPVNQHDKMDKFLATIETLDKLEFKLHLDAESIEQFVSAF